MPRSSKHKINQSEKPAWMLAAEQRLEAAEQNSKDKHTPRTTKSSSVSSSKQPNYKKVTTQKSSENMDKPAWMLAAEARLEDEANEKEIKRKDRLLKTISSSKKQEEEDENKDINKASHAPMPTQKELTLLKEILDENKKENSENDLKEKTLKSLEEMKRKDMENYDHLQVDTSLYDAQLDNDVKDSNIREKKMLQLIEEAKQRMKVSCELAATKREEYVNSRCKVPVFATSLPDSDDEGDGSDGNESNDFWGLEEGPIVGTDSGQKVDVVPKKTFEEMKKDFFQNIDRLQREVSDARSEHFETITSMHNAMAKSNK